MKTQKQKRTKVTYEIAKSLFHDNGCVLLSKEYINAKSKLQYQCVCGNIAYICYDKFRIGQRCEKCKRNKLSKKFRLDSKFVSQCFEKRGCELLSEYTQKHDPVFFKCVCGNIGYTCFNNFQAGRLCRICGLNNKAGKNHYKWRHDISDEERKIRKGRLDMWSGWRLLVYNRDKYTCQLCESNSHLNAHHLNSYDIYPLERNDVDNGITLCENCHYAFHKKYGRGKNTKYQYEEYKNTFLTLLNSKQLC